MTHYCDLFAKIGDLLVYFPLRKPQKPHNCTLLAFLVNQGTYTPPPTSGETPPPSTLKKDPPPRVQNFQTPYFFGRAQVCTSLYSAHALVGVVPDKTVSRSTDYWASSI